MERRKRALDGLDQDIRDHIERETQDNVDRGMAPEEARRQAMLRFGNVALITEDTQRRLGLAIARRHPPGFPLRAPHAAQESCVCRSSSS